MRGIAHVIYSAPGPALSSKCGADLKPRLPPCRQVIVSAQSLDAALVGLALLATAGSSEMGSSTRAHGLPIPPVAGAPLGVRALGLGDMDWQPWGSHETMWTPAVELMGRAWSTFTTLQLLLFFFFILVFSSQSPTTGCAVHSGFAARAVPRSPLAAHVTHRKARRCFQGRCAW